MLHSFRHFVFADVVFLIVPVLLHILNFDEVRLFPYLLV